MNRVPRRRGIGQTGNGIVRNDIEKSRLATQQRRQLAGVLGLVIDAGQQDILKRQPAIGDFQIAVSSSQNVGQADVLVDGHDLVTQRIVRCVQRHRQVVSRVQFTQAVQLFGQSHRADRDSPVTNAQAVVGARFVECWQQIVEVGQRLPHSHHHDIAQSFLRRQPSLKQQHLFHDLAGRQIAIDAVEAAGTKDAPHGAANLSADADRPPIFIAQQHAFDLAAIRQFQEQLFGAIVRLQMPRDGTRPQRKVAGELAPERFRQVAHLLEALDPTGKHPLANLRSAKTRVPALGKPGLQRFPTIGVEQVRHSCIIQPTPIRPRVPRHHMSKSKATPVSSPSSCDQPRAQQLVLELMAIPAKSGEEAIVADFIRKVLHAAGAPASAIVTDNAHKQALIAGNTGNLILKLPGTFKAPRRMLTAHMDTVPICVGSQPKVQGQYVRSANPASGLGADNRSGSAAILTAAREILEHKLPHPPLTFCWFIQEEVGLQGARFVQQSLLGKPAMCFNWDGGSADKLTVGATGGYRMVIEVEGLAAHAGVCPEKGVSAIAIASLAIADLQRGGWHGLVEKGKHRGTSNVGFVHGGEATNVVTDRVTLKAEARSHDPKFRGQIIKAMEKAFQSAAKEVRSAEGKRGQVCFEGRLDYEAFRVDPRHPCVQMAAAAVRATGRSPFEVVSNGGLDANWLNAHGIPTVTLGSGQMNVHTTSEMLDLASYRDACQIALQLATMP